MSKLIRGNAHFINLLTSGKLSSRQRATLIRQAKKREILTLSEIVLNLLKNNFDLSDEEKTALLPYRNALRRIATSKEKFEWKKRQALIAKYSKAIFIVLNIVKSQLSDILE
jgi:hypothetical protein